MLGSREITLGHLAISPIGKSLDVYIKMFSYEVSSQYMNVINVPTSWDLITLLIWDQWHGDGCGVPP